ncbi:MAG: hypothetical protein K0B15_05260 [Lentimicrobium sp.]|nr:hypothetical protein [Lentimicrobium sp.]
MKTLLTYLSASALTLTCFGSVSAGIKTLALNNFTLDNVLADTLAIFSFTDVALPKTTEETYVDDIPFDTGL